MRSSLDCRLPVFYIGQLGTHPAKIVQELFLLTWDQNTQEQIFPCQRNLGNFIMQALTFGSQDQSPLAAVFFNAQQQLGLHVPNASTGHRLVHEHGLADVGRIAQRAVGQHRQYSPLVDADAEMSKVQLGRAGGQVVVQMTEQRRDISIPVNPGMLCVHLWRHFLFFIKGAHLGSKGDRRHHMLEH